MTRSVAAGLCNAFYGGPFVGMVEGGKSGEAAMLLVLFAGFGAGANGFNFSCMKPGMTADIHTHPISDECIVNWWGGNPVFLGDRWLETRSYDCLLAPSGSGTAASSRRRRKTRCSSAASPRRRSSISSSTAATTRMADSSVRPSCGLRWTDCWSLCGRGGGARCRARCAGLLGSGRFSVPSPRSRQGYRI